MVLSAPDTDFGIITVVLGMPNTAAVVAYDWRLLEFPWTGLKVSAVDFHFVNDNIIHCFFIFQFKANYPLWLPCAFLHQTLGTYDAVVVVKLFLQLLILEFETWVNVEDGYEETFPGFNTRDT